MKDYNEMSDHELLMELIEEKRRNDKIRTIKYAALATIGLLIVISLIIFIPKILSIIDKYNQIIDQLNQTNTKIDEFMKSFDFSSNQELHDFIEQLKQIFSRFSFLGE